MRGTSPLLVAPDPRQDQAVTHTARLPDAPPFLRVGDRQCVVHPKPLWGKALVRTWLFVSSAPPGGLFRNADQASRLFGQTNDQATPEPSRNVAI